MSGQDDPNSLLGKLGPNPLFIIDSQQVSKADLGKFDTNTITKVVVSDDTSATNRYGNLAKDGAVIAETRAFARRMFVSFFRKSSQTV